MRTSGRKSLGEIRGQTRCSLNFDAEKLGSVPVCPSLLILPDLTITETIDEVIVYHSNRLHVRISDCRANEAESAVLEVLAECLGLLRSRWNLPCSLPVVKLGPSLDKTPAIGIETPELFLDFEAYACVAHCGFDLHPVTNDLRIGYKLLDLSLGVARDFLRIELVERAAITFSLLQHERPAQSGLRA